MIILKQRPQSTTVPRVDHFINSFFGRDMAQLLGHDDVAMDLPRVNITESKEAYKLDILAPGFRKEDLRLNVEESIITISAEHKDEQLNEGTRFTRREFSLRPFKRSFRLPEQVDADRISAEYGPGVLTIRIPKAAPVKPAQREISIG